MDSCRMSALHFRHPEHGAHPLARMPSQLPLTIDKPVEKLGSVALLRGDVGPHLDEASRNGANTEARGLLLLTAFILDAARRGLSIAAEAESRQIPRPLAVDEAGVGRQESVDQDLRVIVVDVLGLRNIRPRTLSTIRASATILLVLEGALVERMDLSSVSLQAFSS